MADRKSRLRKVFKAAGVLSIFLILLLVTVPCWFPWLLRPAARSLGVELKSYDRVGYSRLVMHDVRYAHKGTTVEVARVEFYQPTAWLWHRYRPGDAFTAEITGWRVEVQDSNAPKTRKSPAKTNSTAQILDQVQKNVNRFRAWLPSATLTDGELILQKQSFRISKANWRDPALHAMVEADRPAQSAILDLALPRQPPYTVTAQLQPLDLRLESRLDRRYEGWELITESSWRTNRASLHAQFDRSGWLPSSFTFDSPQIIWPLTNRAWAGYHHATGAIHLAYSSGDYNGLIHAGSAPLPGLSIPEVRAHLVLTGNLESVTIERLDVTSPAAIARLTHPVTVDRSGTVRSAPARFDIGVDLAHVPHLNVTGGISGTITLAPNDTRGFTAQTIVRATNVHYGDFQVTALDLTSTWNGFVTPDLVLEMQLTNDARFRFEGSGDVKAKTISTAAWTFQGALPANLMPTNITIGSIQATGQLSGALTNLQHFGNVTVTQFVTDRTLPMDIQFRWKGSNTTMTSASLLARAKSSELSAEFKTQLLREPTVQLITVLDKFTLQQSNAITYALIEPATIAVGGAQPTNSTWSLSVSNFHWETGERSIYAAGDLAWPSRGDLRAELRRFEPRVLADFVVVPKLDWSIRDLALRGKWQDGPLFLTVKAAGALTWPAEGTFTANLDLTSNDTNLLIQEIVVATETGTLLSLDGTLPVIITPGISNWYRVLPKGELNLHGEATTNRNFWDRLSEITRIGLLDPVLKIDLHGHALRPEGKASLSARRVEWLAAEKEIPLPLLENLDISLVINEGALTLEQFRLEVAGQPVLAHASLPLAPNFWTRLASEPDGLDWSKLCGDLKIPDADLAPFAHYARRLAVPQGRLSLDLQVEPGYSLQGTLRLTNAATRPLSSLGPVRDIHATVLFEKQSATIEDFAGQVGGQPVHLDGKIQWTGRTLPDFDLHLVGTAVPLVRQPGSLIRSDLDVRLRHASNSVVRVSGDVRLTNSFYLQEIASLIPRGVTQPAQRPPYFSVDQPPFSDWQLDLRIQGDRFLKVRSPLFRGEVSTRLELKGTLEEPIALGQAGLHGAVIQFPFGNLRVDQGLLDLTSENPHDPQLLILASGRVFGYNVKLEMTGSATTPVLAFSSTPPLSSEQIVLMLTAGELPKRETAFSSKQKAGRLALYLGRDILTKFAGSDAAERLSISSGENISEQGDPTYYLEYKLNEDWSVIGEYDRFNALNAGLKWRLYSK